MIEELLFKKKSGPFGTLFSLPYFFLRITPSFAGMVIFVRYFPLVSMYRYLRRLMVTGVLRAFTNTVAY